MAENTANAYNSDLYTSVATLAGPKDAVLSLKFSAFAKYVSATGINGIDCWEVETSAPMPAITTYAPLKKNRVYPVSAWVYFNRNSAHYLLVGDQKGHVLAWKWSPDDKVFTSFEAPDTPEAPILSLEVLSVEVREGSRARIAASFADRSVRVWALTSAGVFSSIIQTETPEGVDVKSICFEPKSMSLYVFALSGGKVSLLAGNTGEAMWTMEGPPIVASLSVNHAADLFVAHTGMEFQIYKLSTLIRMYPLDCEKQIVPFPKDVEFAEEGRKIVTGTDRGKAVVYDTESGKVLQNLKYTEDGLVQTVATCALVDRFLIAIAGSASQQASEVVLWEKMRDPPAPRPDPAPPSAVIRPVYYSSKYWKHGLGTLAVLLTVLVAVWYQDSVIAPNLVGLPIRHFLERIRSPAVNAVNLSDHVPEKTEEDERRTVYEADTLDSSPPVLDPVPIVETRLARGGRVALRFTSLLFSYIFIG